MFAHSPRVRGFGLRIAVAFFALAFLSAGVAWASPPFLPDGPQVPTITLNEGPAGEPGLPRLHEPPPKPFGQQSIWNMEVVGFADDLGCSQSDQVWIENQNGREILYAGAAATTITNPKTGMKEACGQQIYDVTDARHPVFLSTIPGDPAGGGAPHAVACSGDLLPNAVKGHFYLATHRGNTGAGQGRHEIWDVTNPSAPTLLTTVLTGLNQYHRIWWECDTGIAYMVAGAKSNGWKQRQHIYIFDLSNPAIPKFIRQWGVVGGQPTANVATAQSCTNAPGPNCFEGVTNPPSSIHEGYSAGVLFNRVYFSLGVGSDGLIQIVDRQKLLTGCTVATASPNCANSPTQADLLYPQVSYITLNPLQGAHSSNPIFGVPIPEEQSSWLDGTPQKWNILVTVSEAGGPPSCVGEAPHVATIVDIINDQAPWPISTLNVSQSPGNFCQRGARFGAHHIPWEIYPPYYGKIQFVTWFNGGLRAFDIRDPLNPRPVAYFIQAPNANTQASQGVPGNPTLMLNAPYMDVADVDDRGYIYGQDRAGSGITILKLTGAALKVVTGHGDEDDDFDDDQR